jgi:multidrug efflux pump
VLQFALSLNIDIAEEEVQSSINAAQSFLPSNLASPPVYNKTNPADAPVLTLAISSDSMPLSQVEDLVDTRLAPKLSQLSGVGLVSISGGQKPAVRIQANPDRAFLVRPEPGGFAHRAAGYQRQLRQGQLRRAAPGLPDQRQRSNEHSDDYRKVVVAYRNGAPGHSDGCRKVVDGIENNKQAAWMNETPAVILNIQRQPGANTITW